MRSLKVLPFVGLIGIAAVFIHTYFFSLSSSSYAVRKILLPSSIQRFSERIEGGSEREDLNSLKEKTENETKTKAPQIGTKEFTLTDVKTIIKTSMQTSKPNTAIIGAIPKKKKHSRKILVFDNIKDDSNIIIKVIYRDLSACEPRPEYLPQYRAHCWINCKENQQCKNPSASSDIKNSTEGIYCFPNLLLIGMRKSGTTDFSRLWIRDIREIENVQKDYYADAELCPVSYMMKITQKIPTMSGGNLYIGAPGTLVTNTKVYKNETHLMITSGIQYIAYMSTTESRFYVQLRNPTDRVISYLFHWRKMKLIPQYKKLKINDFTESFVDELIRRLMVELKQCIARNDEVACAYMPDSFSGNLDVLITHSLYVVYIEEMFKFIPKEQVMIKTMEEYSNDRESTAAEVIKQFFGVKTSKRFKAKGLGRVVNRGHKNPVLPSTLQLLDEFFAPYNQRLSELLGDPKFLFTKSRV